jgi:spermidine synthase
LSEVLPLKPRHRARNAGEGATFPARRLIQAVVLVSGAVLMSLEILGSRVLAPKYGSSVFVWGSLITTFLIALALGYALGGRLADRYPSRSVLSAILAVGSLAILPAVAWGAPLLEKFSQLGWDVRWSSLAASLVLFLPASLAMGMVTPFAVRIAIRRMESAGSVAGGYSALSTAGSILGTLATAFLLIPAFPLPSLLLGLAGALAICSLLLAGDRRSLLAAFGAIVTCAAVASFSGPVRYGYERVLFRKDTAYHHIAVTEFDSARYLRFDALTQSGVNIRYPDRFIYSYTEALLVPFVLRPSISRVCVIGLGGGVVPSAATRLKPGTVVDSVEIDPVVRDVAVKYFLYRESATTRTFIEDGRVFLSHAGPAYDLIVVDAFNSTGAPFHLTTREFFATAQARLTRDGVLAVNFIGQMMGKDARLFWAAYQTIRRQFGQVYLLSPEIASGNMAPRGNIILIATVSADPIDMGKLREAVGRLPAAWQRTRVPELAGELIHSPEPPPGTPELTDAFAPVEALQHY